MARGSAGAGAAGKGWGTGRHWGSSLLQPLLRGSRGHISPFSSNAQHFHCHLTVRPIYICVQESKVCPRQHIHFPLVSGKEQMKILTWKLRHHLLIALASPASGGEMTPGAGSGQQSRVPISSCTINAGKRALQPSGTGDRGQGNRGEGERNTKLGNNCIVRLGACQR